jgi:hypothetical protein
MSKFRNQNLKNKITGIFILISVFIGIPLSGALAQMDDFTEVINEVWVEANTGGNSAEGGVIQEGNAKSSVQVKTIINGEVVEDINETVESGSEPTSIIKEFEKVIGEGTGKVRTEIELKVNELEQGTETATSALEAKVQEKKETAAKRAGETVKNLVTNIVDKIWISIKNLFKIF